MMVGGGGWSFKWDRSGGVLGEFTGTIKSGGKAYSFIKCPEAGKGDIFLHWEERKAYKTGQTVKFTLLLNKDGKPNAIKLKSVLKSDGDTGSMKSGGKAKFGGGAELGEY